MNQEQIKMLIDAFAASDLSMLEFSENGCTLRLARQGAAIAGAGAQATPPAPAGVATAPVPTTPPAAAEAEAAAGAIEIAAPPTDVLAPLYGVVHLRPAPGEPDFVRPGEAVEAGRTLCVIEAMKVFNEVHAERAGTIAAVRVESGQEVDAGQILFTLG